METVYYTEIADEVVYTTLSRMTSQTFKLLPMREEGQDWIKPLETLSLELLGLSKIFPDNPSFRLVEKCAECNALRISAL